MRMTDTPNIVLLLCDQLRPFELGCYGHESARTPNLDQLAREGVRFETAVSNCPLCMPARSAVLSGQHPRTCLGHHGNELLPFRSPHFTGLIPEWARELRRELPGWTLPEVLKARGYRTGAVGKWHIPTPPRLLGFDYSFIPQNHHRHSGQQFSENGQEPVVVSGWSLDAEAERVDAFMHRQKGAPFFLYYNVSPPHCPLADAPAHYLRLFNAGLVALRPNVPSPPPFDEKAFQIYLWDYLFYQENQPHTWPLPAGCDLRQIIAYYQGLTTWVDDMVSRLRASLDDAEVADNTIIVFSSDHGDNLGSHGLFQKGQLYEESIRVPLIFHAPDRWAPAVRRMQVAQLIDLMPTLLDTVGFEPLPHLHGRSLLPLLADKREALAENYAILENQSGHIGIRTPTHLYAAQRRSRDQGPLADRPLHFFDLIEDPFQQRDQATLPRDSALAVQLHEIVNRWHQSTPWLATP